MRKFTTIAAALLMTTGMALAQTPSGNDTPTNRGAQPVKPGNQSGSSQGQQGSGGMSDPNTGAGNMGGSDVKANERKPTDSQTSGGASPVKPGAPGTK